MGDFAAIEKALREAFPMCHIDISFYPVGGNLHISLCPDCGAEFHKLILAGWSAMRGETLADAVTSALAEIEKIGGGNE